MNSLFIDNESTCKNSVNTAMDKNASDLLSATLIPLEKKRSAHFMVTNESLVVMMFVNKLSRAFCNILCLSFPCVSVFLWSEWESTADSDFISALPFSQNCLVLFQAKC